MPIDADAYMAGHIPTLSRGGSWLPPAHPVAAYGQRASRGPTTTVLPPLARASSATRRPTLATPATAPPNSPAIGRSSVNYDGWASQAGGTDRQRSAGASAVGSAAPSGLRRHAPARLPLPRSQLNAAGRSDQSPRSPHAQHPPHPLHTQHTPRTPHSPRTAHPAHVSHTPHAAQTPHTSQPPALPTAHTSRPPRAPASPSVSISSRSYRLGNGHWPGGSWEEGAGAPKRIGAEANYAIDKDKQFTLGPLPGPTTARRARADTLPPAPSESAHTRARHKSTGHAVRGTPSAVSDAPPLQPARPRIARRHTHEPLHHAPATVGHGATAVGRSRLSSHVEFGLPDDTASGGSRVDDETTTYDLAPLRDALPPGPHGPQGYISPHSEEGYDRYVAHPAARTPPRSDRARVQSTAGGGGGAGGSHRPSRLATSVALPADAAHEYFPVIYPDKTRDMPPVDRAGPLMRTHGVPWSSEAIPLPHEPEGPRWVQARPPRAEVVEGGAWGHAGGQGW